MFPGHPQTARCPRAVGPSSDKWDMSLWPSQQQGHYLGRGSCPLPAVRGRSPLESSRAEESETCQVHSCGETLTQFVFNQTPHIDTWAPINHFLKVPLANKHLAKYLPLCVFNRKYQLYCSSPYSTLIGPVPGCSRVECFSKNGWNSFPDLPLWSQEQRTAW